MEGRKIGRLWVRNYARVDWSITLDRKTATVIVKEVVVKELIAFKPSIMVNTPTETSSSQVVRETVAARVSSLKSNAQNSGSKNQPLFNFSIFKEYSFNTVGIETVIVEIRYVDNKALRPERQWCYLSANNLDVIATQINLAFKGKKNERKPTLSLRMDQTLCLFE